MEVSNVRGSSRCGGERSCELYKGARISRENWRGKSVRRVVARCPACPMCGPCSPWAASSECCDHKADNVSRCSLYSQWLICTCTAETMGSSGRQAATSLPPRHLHHKYCHCRSVTLNWVSSLNYQLHSGKLRGSNGLNSSPFLSLSTRLMTWADHNWILNRSFWMLRFFWTFDWLNWIPLTFPLCSVCRNVV